MNIAVIGGGVIGLSAALRLSAVARVEVFTRDDPAETTSTRAGAVFSAFDAGDMVDVLSASAVAFAELAGDGDAGVSLRPSSEYWSRPGPIPAWTGVVARALGKRVQSLAPVGPYAGGFRLTVPQVDIPRYMPWLRGRVVASGVSIKRRGVDAVALLFGEGFDLVVNASGLGARVLAEDPAVRPMRGQVVHVPNDLGLTEALDATEPDGSITYIYPFAEHVVLGGTYEHDEQACVTEPGALDAMTERCRALLGCTGRAGAAGLGRVRLRALAGLRPARVVGGQREAVRLELERTKAGPVVHAYGHGRAGVTLSWGTAARVVELVGQV